MEAYGMDVLFAGPDEETLWPAEAPTVDTTVEWVDSPSSLDDRLSAGSVDCLVVDTSFADGDALGVFEQVREAVPDLPFVLYGSGVDDATAQQLYESPWTEYVTRDGIGSQWALARRVSDLCTAPDRDAHLEGAVVGDGSVALTVSSDRTVRVATGEVELLFGQSATDIQGVSVDELLPSRAVAAVFDGETEHTLVTMTQANGTERSAEVVVQRGRSENRRTVVLRTTHSPERQRRSEFESAVDRVTEALFGVDEEWRFTYLNDRAVALFDEPREALLGRDIWDAFGHPIGSTFERNYQRAMDEQTEVRFREYDPRLEQWLEARAFPSATGLSVHLRDVTESVQADAGLQALQRATSALADSDALESGLSEAVGAVVEETDWDYGEAWTVGDAGLETTDAWTHDPLEPIADETSLDAIRSHLADVNVDDAFVGRAVRRAETVYAQETDDPLQTAVAVPVVSQCEVIAVFVFGLHVAREWIDRLTETAESVATEVGTLATRLDRRTKHRRQTNKFEAVFNDPNTHVAFLDTDGTVQRVNGVVEEVSGSAGLDLVGMRYWEHPWYESSNVDPERVRAAVEAAAEGEYTELHSVNETLYDGVDAFDTTIRPVEGDDGIEGILVETSDVTERHRATRRAEERERQFEAIFQDPATPVALLDTDGIVRQHNDTGQEIARRVEFESVGRPFWEIPYFSGTDMSEETLRGCIGNAADGEYVRFETVNPDYDGELAAFDTSIRPVYDTDDEVEALVVESRDISQRVEADEERRQKERQFDAAFEDPTASILLLDETGRIERANEMATRGPYEEDDLIGLPYWDHPWWDDADIGPDDPRACIERAASGEYVRFETANESDDIDWVALDVSLRPVFGDDEVVGIVVEALDVSEQHRLERDLREERNLTQRILETSPVGIAIVTDDGETEFVNPRGEELVGDAESLSAAPPELRGTDGVRLTDDERPFRRVFERNEALFGMEVGVELREGIRWLSVNGAPLGDGRAVMTFEDVTEQRRHTRQLTALVEAAQQLSDAPSPVEVATTAVDRAEPVIGTGTVAIALHDDESGRLEPVPGSDDSLAAYVADGATDRLGWVAYLDGEPAVDESVSAFPLGDRGVLLARTPDGLAQTTRRLVDLFVATVSSELARADREADLRTKSEELAARTAELERLNSVNDIIRGLTRRLLDADTREAVEQAACESFAEASPYRLAWVGQSKSGSMQVTTTSSGPEAVPDRLVNDGRVSPAVQAERGQCVEIREALHEGDGDEPWRTYAVEHDLRASASVPLVNRETCYGVLTLYAAEPNSFGALEREVLTELGEMVGYTIAALERKQALVSDRSTELEISFPVSKLRLFPFLQSESITMTIREMLPRGDGRAHIFFETTGVDPETVLEETAPAPGIDHIDRMDSGDSDADPQFEAVLSASSATARLLERGFLVHNAEVVGDRLHLTIRASTDADPREVLEAFETAYDEVSLVSKREVAQPVRSREAFEASYLADLTPRQEEVLRTAHAAGFFEWPRVNSGQEVAEMLDVSQPTVNRHLREAERKLFSKLFDST